VQFIGEAAAGGDLIPLLHTNATHTHTHCYSSAIIQHWTTLSTNLQRAVYEADVERVDQPPRLHTDTAHIQHAPLTSE
jgi:hypothetical protein